MAGLFCENLSCLRLSYNKQFSGKGGDRLKHRPGYDVKLIWHQKGMILWV